MALKARATTKNRAGIEVVVYATLQGDTVWLHSKDASYGGFNISRFNGGKLTSVTLQAFLSGGSK